MQKSPVKKGLSEFITKSNDRRKTEVVRPVDKHSVSSKIIQVYVPTVESPIKDDLDRVRDKT